MADHQQAPHQYEVYLQVTLSTLYLLVQMDNPGHLLVHGCSPVQPVCTGWSKSSQSEKYSQEPELREVLQRNPENNKAGSDLSGLIGLRHLLDLYGCSYSMPTSKGSFVFLKPNLEKSLLRR